MHLVLEGEILTPIITKSATFHTEGCRIRILQPRRRYFNKITTGKPMLPYSFKAYLGKVELSRKIKSIQAAKRKLKELLSIEAIGRFTAEGMGLVDWKLGRIDVNGQANQSQGRKIRIRKGLPRFLPKELQRLIQYALLHDFFHTSKHSSKIYVEPELEDLTLIELLRQHHTETENELIQQFQRFDRIAAIITRKIRSPRTNRYTWASQAQVDFEQLAIQIAEANKKGVWELYRFIYTSKELEELNESLEHGHNSLRNHLLLVANLIVQDSLSRSAQQS
ncbi:MAG: hypothetical protein ACFFGZ_12610 [Candidatus Thorarchaeota archaeon]